MVLVAGYGCVRRIITILTTRVLLTTMATTATITVTTTTAARPDSEDEELKRAVFAKEPVDMMNGSGAGTCFLFFFEGNNVHTAKSDCKHRWR